MQEPGARRSSPQPRTYRVGLLQHKGAAGDGSKADAGAGEVEGNHAALAARDALVVAVPPRQPRRGRVRGGERAARRGGHVEQAQRAVGVELAARHPVGVPRRERRRRSAGWHKHRRALERLQRGAVGVRQRRRGDVDAARRARGVERGAGRPVLCADVELKPRRQGAAEAGVGVQREVIPGGGGGRALGFVVRAKGNSPRSVCVQISAAGACMAAGAPAVAAVLAAAERCGDAAVGKQPRRQRAAQPIGRQPQLAGAQDERHPLLRDGPFQEVPVQAQPLNRAARGAPLRRQRAAQLVVAEVELRPLVQRERDRERRRQRACEGHVAGGEGGHVSASSGEHVSSASNAPGFNANLRMFQPQAGSAPAHPAAGCQRGPGK